MKTVENIAKSFGVSRVSVYNWINNGLPYTRKKAIGHKVRIMIEPSEVFKYHKSVEEKAINKHLRKD